MKGDLIFEPSYWKGRLEKSEVLRHAIYRCPDKVWVEIEKHHRKSLLELIQPGDSILDVGCGWGRLLDLLPVTWQGDYYGIDLCPEFINLAKTYFPQYTFSVCDFREIYKVIPLITPLYAVMISIRPMVLREVGREVWEEVELDLRKVAKKLLYLEYENPDQGAKVE